MTLGAQPKKIALLVILAGAAGYLLYSNLISGDGRPVTPRSTLRRDFDAPPAAEPRTPATPGLAARSSAPRSSPGARTAALTPPRPTPLCVSIFWLGSSP
jgi:hypothetical protein